MSNVEVLAGSGEIDHIASSALWASGQGPDPLAEAVTFDGLQFVAFLLADPTAPGGWQPYVQGLAVSCDVDGLPIESLADPPPNTSGLTLDELADAVRALDD